MTSLSFKKISVAVFSALTLILFYKLTSSNGFILGNDPAVHLSKAYEMLETGKVSVSEVTWYPPLYRIFLAELMAFTGATSFEGALLIAKMLTAVIDWLLIFSVYLLGSRLIKPECGLIASTLLLLCFPLYEINFWGGYPSLLSIVYVCLLFLYIPSKMEHFANKIVILLIIFSIVLTHQFTTFLAVVVLMLYALILIIARKSVNSLLVIAILGAATASILWYVPVIMPYLNILISHVFFSQRQYFYLIKRVSLDIFLLNFGFIILFALLGAFLTFFEFKKRRDLDFYMLLCLGFFVPLLFTQSYLFNLMLPYDRFVYYLMPPAAVFAAAIVYLLIKLAASNSFRISRKKLIVYSKAVLITFIIILMLTSRFPALTSKISEASEYYSYLDSPAYHAGLWLRNNYPSKSAVVVTEKPGIFFGLVSGKFAIMETDPLVERAALAETVLDLAYEMENPLTLFRVFEARIPYELDQFNVLVHNVWKRASFLYDEETSVSYVKNGESFTLPLSDLNRKIVWIEEDDYKRLQIQYCYEGKFILTQNIKMEDCKLPVNVNWTFTSLDGKVDKLYLYLSIHFDLHFSFEKVYVPGMLDWGNPWDKPSSREETGKWVLMHFDPKKLTKNYVGVYDSINRIFFAVKFTDLPESGNVGALSSRKVDALRFIYHFESINHTVSAAYSVINFSEESFQSLDLNNFVELFDLKSEFNVQYRDYLTYLEKLDIQFLIFDAKRFRKELLHSSLLHIIYSNGKYIICKIRGYFS